MSSGVLRRPSRPELFDYVLEVKDEGAVAGPVLTPAPAGPGRVSLAAPVRRRPAGIEGH